MTYNKQLKKEIQILRKNQGHIHQQLIKKYKDNKFENEGFIEWICKIVSEYWFS